MKKAVSIVATVLALTLVLVGCGSKQADTSTLVDGSYRAEMSDAYADNEGHGWKGYVVLTVTDGAIADVDFDYSNGEGALKSEQSQEEYPMDPHPSTWIPELEKQGKEASSADDIDAITDATASSGEFKELYTAALDAAKAGNQETIVLH